MDDIRKAMLGISVLDVVVCTKVTNPDRWQTIRPKWHLGNGIVTTKWDTNDDGSATLHNDTNTHRIGHRCSNRREVLNVYLHAANKGIRREVNMLLLQQNPHDDFEYVDEPIPFC